MSKFHLSNLPLPPNLPQTALFLGSTSGIGLSTLKALLHHAKQNTTPLKIYVVGRHTSKEKTQDALGHPLNGETSHGAKVHWIESEVSLLREVRRVVDFVREREERLDLVWCSVGYPPFGGRRLTEEGLEKSQVLSYHARILLSILLNPLLAKSPSPRVIHVLSGPRLLPSLPKTDLFLDAEDGANFSPIKSISRCGTMLTLTLDKLSALGYGEGESEGGIPVTYIHSYPGAVDTGNMKRGWDGEGWRPRVLGGFASVLAAVVGISVAESGERHLFLATSGVFGLPEGHLVDGMPSAKNTRGEVGKGGLFLVNEACETVDPGEALEKLRVEAQDLVWGETLRILKPFLD